MNYNNLKESTNNLKEGSILEKKKTYLSVKVQIWWRKMKNMKGDMNICINYLFSLIQVAKSPALM